MHERLLGEQLVLRFFVVGVVHAAVYRTDCGTLGFVVKAYTFGAFVRCDVVNVHAARFLRGLGVDLSGRRVVPISFQSSSIRKCPFCATFIDGVVGAFGFAGSAIDAGVGDHDGHGVVLSWNLALSKNNPSNPQDVATIFALSIVS